LPSALPLTVYARWGTGNSNASNANYVITHAGGTDTVTVNQNVNDGTWFKLGTYDLAPNAGHKGEVGSE